MPRLRRWIGRLARGRRFRPDSTMMLWGVGIALILLFVWEQSTVDRLIMKLERAEDHRRDLDSEVNALMMEADQLSSLAQVERRATDELGLIRPDPDQIVRLEFEESREASPHFSLDPLVPEAVAGMRGEESPR